MFFSHWHRGLDTEQVAFYNKVLDRADKKLDEILKPIRDAYENKNNSDYMRTRIIQAIKETLERAGK